MNEFIKKLIERLEELIDKSFNESLKGYPFASTRNGAYQEVKTIVNQLAEEYNNTSTEYINSSTDTSTNADHIRAMSDEELAEWLAVIDHYWDDGECVVSFGDAHVHDSKYDILEWLQSEAEQQ